MWKKLANRREVWLFLSFSLVLMITVYHRPTPAPIPFKNPSPENIHNSHGFRYVEDSIIYNEINTQSPSKGNAMNHDEELPWWDGGDCLCDSKGHCRPRVTSLETSIPPRLLHVNGTCGRKASADGTGQKVISFTLFGNNSNYWTGLSQSLPKIKRLYPGWKVWLYTDPRGRSEALCPLLQKYSIFRVCDVNNLPKPLYNISKVLPTMWRISPLGDPTVDALLVRDTDMLFTEREQAAVQDWLDSLTTFHVMRDHPAHHAYILAGMWGARWDVEEKPNSSDTIENGNLIRFKNSAPSAQDMRRLRNSMLKMAYLNDEKSLDQVILRRVLWPEMVGFVVAHDSYLCDVFKSGSKPWPTKRINGTFVGNRWFRGEVMKSEFSSKCPTACRPPDHPDWQYC